MNKKRQQLTIICVIMIYILGMIGFYQSYSHSILDCLYATTTLFTMSLMASTDQINIYIEIARWLAIFVSVNIIFTIVQSLYVKYQDYHHLKNKNVVVIHGNSPLVAKININIKDSIVMNHNILWKAKRHIFAFQSNNEMLQYLFDHQDWFQNDQKFYLLTHTLRRGSYEKQNIILCNLAENCARLYWKQYPLQFDEEMIVIIGFDTYGKEMLNQALLLNILSTHSHVQYHIFGSGAEYLSHHYQLHQCLSIQQVSEFQDSLIFYEDSWQNHQDILLQADRLIFVEDQDEDNLNLLNLIKKYYVVKRIDMKYVYTDSIEYLWGNEINVFGDEKNLLSEDVILNERTMHDAMNIHAHYLQQYVCQKQCHQDCLTCSFFLEDWSHLSSFVRYSNVAQADHIFNKIRILQHQMKDLDISLKDYYQQLDDNQLSELEEIEHIRWCRYHYLHNWQYGEKRNNEKKIHPLLIDYQELKDFDKRKDRHAWEEAIKSYEDALCIPHNK